MVARDNKGLMVKVRSLNKEGAIAPDLADAVGEISSFMDQKGSMAKGDS